MKRDELLALAEQCGVFKDRAQGMENLRSALVQYFASEKGKRVLAHAPKVTFVIDDVTRTVEYAPDFVIDSLLREVEDYAAYRAKKQGKGHTQ